MKKILIISILISIFIGCNKKHLPELLELSNPPVIEFDSKYTLVKSKDILNISLPPGVPNYIGLVDCLVNDSVYYFKYATNKIAKINLLKGSVDSIILSDETLVGNIKSINKINEDTIVFIQDNPQSFILLNSEGQGEFHILPKIDFSCQNETFNRYTESLSEGAGNYIVDYSSIFFDSKKQFMHIGFKPLMAYNNTGFEESERIGVYNLRSKEWTRIYAPPLGILKYKEKETFTYLLSQKRIFARNDTLFINYFNDHYIYYYKDGIYLGKFPHISQHSKSISLPVSKTYLEDEENRKKYTYAAPKYGNFSYHEEAKLYSRFYFDLQEPLDSKGRYKHQELQRDIYVVFLDDQFKYVGEYKFPKGSLTFNSCKPVSDGFLLFDLKEKTNTSSAFNLKHKYNIVKIAEDLNAE